MRKLKFETRNLQSEAMKIFLILAMSMSFMFLFLSSVKAADKSCSQALSYCESCRGSKVGTGQCVSFANAYINYIGGTSISGNAKDFATSPIPSGWSRVKGGVPQSGDILVYTGAKYGHVAVYAGGTTSYHQNMSGKYVEKKTNWPYNKSWYSSAEKGTKSYWGYIRPDFAGNGIDPEIHDDKNEVRVGETMTFVYSGLRPCSKAEFCFMKNGNVYYSADSTSSRYFSTYFEKPGTYQVFARGLLNGKWYESRKITVEVLAPWIGSDKSMVGVGQNITFEYSGLTQCSKALFSFVKDGRVYHTVDSTASRKFTTYFQAPGTYQVFASGLLNGKWFESDRITIVVR